VAADENRGGSLHGSGAGTFVGPEGTVLLFSSEVCQGATDDDRVEYPLEAVP
jgi:hypothetical protein